VIRQDDTASTRQQVAVAHQQQQLRQIGQLTAEYAELADRTGNADLTALIFQVQLVLGEDHVSSIQPHSTTDTAINARLAMAPTDDRAMSG
jgi:hypothetical protein